MGAHMKNIKNSLHILTAYTTIYVQNQLQKITPTENAMQY